MKCQRCGNEAMVEEGIVLTEPVGPDATRTLELEGIKGTITAAVCEDCARMLHLLGWGEAQKQDSVDY